MKFLSYIALAFAGLFIFVGCGDVSPPAADRPLPTENVYPPSPGPSLSEKTNSGEVSGELPLIVAPGPAAPEPEAKPSAVNSIWKAIARGTAEALAEQNQNSGEPSGETPSPEN